MAKKKITKAAKRWKKKRDITRVEKDRDTMWNILKGKNGRENITLFTADERKQYFAKPQAIGTIQCPFCAKPKVLVANKDGDKGKPEEDYIMRHNGAKSIMCDASLVSVQNLFKEKGQSVV